jgi:hypothetical protein
VIGDAPASTVVSVAVGQAPDPAHAPAPRTAAERIVFRQLYETLVRVDCAGTVLPGIAASWSADEHGRVWQFRLHPGASFADGAPLDARAVVESWTAPAVLVRASAVFASVSAASERDLRVELRAASLQPYVFADPGLAVARRVANASWPIGSGVFRVEGSTDARVTRIVQRAARAGAPAAIEFRTIANADPRAALDMGMDVVVTSDATAVAYAHALPAYDVTPLPWNRTYILATRALRVADDTLMGPSTNELAALARDALPRGTRPAVPPFWPDAVACRPVVPTQPTPTGARARALTIAYPRGDAVARAIAERLVALAWPASRTPSWLRALLPRDYGAAGPPVAAAMAEAAVLDSLRTGRGLTFVVPLPRNAAAPCAGAALDAEPGDAGLTGTPNWRITPLLDAHDYLVHRRNFGVITVESDGTIRFDGGSP